MAAGGAAPTTSARSRATVERIDFAWYWAQVSAAPIELSSTRISACLACCSQIASAAAMIATARAAWLPWPAPWPPPSPPWPSPGPCAACSACSERSSALMLNFDLPRAGALRRRYAVA
ncbi:MAG: hypothetical protein WDN04_12220 [Rhodospirillales bacterium]